MGSILEYAFVEARELGVRLGEHHPVELQCIIDVKGRTRGSKYTSRPCQTPSKER